MRTSRVLAKLKRGEFVRATALGHFLPYFIRHAAHQKFDVIWLDLEHRAMTSREVQALLALCHYNNIDCMVRPSDTSRPSLYRFLEDGASGFMIPFVDNAEIAQRIVQSIKFPPLGNRGLDGVGLDADFGVGSGPGSTFTTDANRETFFVAQLETPEAVANADEIAAVEGLDMLFLGPGDLGLRLGAEGGPDAIVRAAEQAAEAARNHGKAWGTITGTMEQMRVFLDMGAQILPWKSEYRCITSGLSAGSQELDQLLESTQTAASDTQ